jgi:hypothetical protein
VWGLDENTKTGLCLLTFSLLCSGNMEGQEETRKVSEVTAAMCCCFPMCSDSEALEPGSELLGQTCERASRSAGHMPWGPC